VREGIGNEKIFQDAIVIQAAVAQTKLDFLYLSFLSRGARPCRMCRAGPGGFGKRTSTAAK